MRDAALPLWAVLVAVIAQACAGSVAPSDAAEDRLPADGGDADLALVSDAAEAGACSIAPTAGACNEGVLEGPEIVATCSPATAPPPAGGVVTSGTYVLESLTYYGFCPAQLPSTRITWLICASAWGTAREVRQADAGVTFARADFQTTVHASDVTLSPTCSDTDAGALESTWGFDATVDRLRLYVPIAPGIRIDSFVRR